MLRKSCGVPARGVARHLSSPPSRSTVRGAGCQKSLATLRLQGATQSGPWAAPPVAAPPGLRLATPYLSSSTRTPGPSRTHQPLHPPMMAICGAVSLPSPPANRTRCVWRRTARRREASSWLQCRCGDRRARTSRPGIPPNASPSDLTCDRVSLRSYTDHGNLTDTSPAPTVSRIRAPLLCRTDSRFAAAPWGSCQHIFRERRALAHERGLGRPPHLQRVLEATRPMAEKPGIERSDRMHGMVSPGSRRPERAPAPDSRPCAHWRGGLARSSSIRPFSMPVTTRCRS